MVNEGGACRFPPPHVGTGGRGSIMRKDFEWGYPREIDWT